MAYKVNIDEEALKHGLFSQWSYNGKTKEELISLRESTKQEIYSDSQQANIYRKEVSQLTPLLGNSEREMNAAKRELDDSNAKLNIAKTNYQTKKSFYETAKTKFYQTKRNYDSAVHNQNKYESSLKSNKTKLFEIEKALGKK